MKRSRYAILNGPDHSVSTVFINPYRFPAGGGGATSFVTSVTAGSTRNNWNGEVGFRFTVGASPITVTELARWVLAGNTNAHNVSIYGNIFTGSPTLIAQVSIDTSGAPTNAFKSEAISPVVLSAATIYCIVSEELSGGDSFLNSNTSITTTTVATVVDAVYRSGTSGAFHNNGGPAGFAYVPPSFSY